MIVGTVQLQINVLEYQDILSQELATGTKRNIEKTSGVQL